VKKNSNGQLHSRGGSPSARRYEQRKTKKNGHTPQECQDPSRLTTTSNPDDRQLHQSGNSSARLSAGQPLILLCFGAFIYLGASSFTSEPGGPCLRDPNPPQAIPAIQPTQFLISS
jgi:hypothetical protein